MNHHRRVLALLFVLLLCCFAKPETLRAAEPHAYTIALQFTPDGKRAYNSSVTRSVGALWTIPLQVSEIATWLVSVDLDDDSGTFNISMVDPSLMGPGGPTTISSAEFKLNSGKSLSFLRTTAGNFEVTITKE